MSEFATASAGLPPDQEALWHKCRHPSGEFIEFPREEIQQSIADRFEKIAALYPDGVAVRTQQESITYRDLNSAANRVARAILEKRGEGNEPIILIFEQGIPSIIAILGTLKAGKIYVPLDPSFPRDRIAAFVKDCQAKLLVTNNQNIAFADSLKDGAKDRLNLDTIGHAAPDNNPRLDVTPDTIASIMYTSGSTGSPKGVVQNHVGILHRVMIYTNMLHVCSKDRLSLLHSPSFGSSIHHLFSSLLNGASLYPFESPLRAGLPLARWLIQEGISIYHSVPSLFRQMTEALSGPEEFSNLRAISLTGAPISIEDVALYQRHFAAQCILIHLMGATETGWIRRYVIDRETPLRDSAVPVGFPIEDKTVALIDEDGKEMPPGQAGEIAVRSRYLAVGYWDNAKLTEEKFISAPRSDGERIYLTGDMGRLATNGCLYHAGRKDFLVKVRGFRVETGEVESALRGLDKVKDVAVLASLDSNAETQLTGYVVPKDQSLLTPTALRQLLREKLPDYMIPQTFVLLNALPLTANGKVDRKALPDPGNARPQIETDYVAPRTDMEKRLAQIWAEALGLSTVGVEDDFVELGGHSLLATRIIGKVHEAFGIEVSIRAFLDAATVAGLAKLASTLGKSRNEIQIRNPAAAGDEEISEI